MKENKIEKPYLEVNEYYSETPYYETKEQFYEAFRKWIEYILRNHEEVE